MDIYDEEIKRLSKDPDKIYSAWLYGDDHSPLFDAAGPVRGPSAGYGCLTQVKGGTHKAASKCLTAAIQADTRIPEDVNKIKLKHLPVFAEWQRKLDKMFKSRLKPKVGA